jgi:hypothetical protein
VSDELEQAAPSEARQTLLRALDALDETEREFGPSRNTYLVVAWAHQVEGQTARGWNSTDDPTFVITGLLREVIKQIETPVSGDDEYDEPSGSD